MTILASVGDLSRGGERGWCLVVVVTWLGSILGHSMKDVIDVDRFAIVLRLCRVLTIDGDVRDVYFIVAYILVCLVRLVVVVWIRFRMLVLFAFVYDIMMGLRGSLVMVVLSRVGLSFNGLSMRIEIFAASLVRVMVPGILM